MVSGRGNPISLEVLSPLPVTDEGINEQVKKLETNIRQTDDDNVGWLYRQKDLTELRVGDKRSRLSGGPWKNSANISMPLTDGIIRRWRPGISSLVLDADPVAYFRAQEPEDIDSARTTEQFFTWLFRDTMDTTNQVVQLADTLAWRGHCYVREGWDYRTARECRLIAVEELFPNLEQLVQAAQQQAAQAGQDIPSAEEIIIDVLEDEYDLDQDGDDEEILRDAAAKILQGAEYIKLVYRRVMCDKPSWQVIDPINVIVPQNQDPENAEFFCIVHEFDEDKVRAKAIDGFWPRNRAEELISRATKSNYPEDGDQSGSIRRDIREVMDNRAGNSANYSDRSVGTFTLWEIYARLDIDGDGEREKVIIWYAPEEKVTLAVYDFPFPFESWPVTYFGFEAAKRPIDNRGIADMVKTPQRLVNSFANARVDAAQILLAPVMQRRIQGNAKYKESIQWRPGGIIPVAEIGDIQPLAQDFRILQGLIQEEQSHQRVAETYVGVFDATLTNLQQSSERRTAAEINAIQGLSGSIFGLDATIFQTALSKSFNKLWMLWQDFGESEVYFRVQNEEQPQLARKHEIAKMYDIKAAGTPANTNRSLQLGILQQAMQVILSSPAILQSGRIDFAKIVERWVQILDYNLSREILRPEEEATLVQQLQQTVQNVGGQDPAAF